MMKKFEICCYSECAYKFVVLATIEATSFEHAWAKYWARSMPTSQALSIRLA